MKRFTGALMGALLLIASVSSAGWHTTPGTWYQQNLTNGIGYKLATNVTAAQAKVDTTADFSIDMADIPPIPVGGKVSATAQDTTILCKLVFYGDSTVASTVVFDATTFKLQANSGASVTGWQDVYTYSSLNTSGQKYCEVPIWLNRAATITRDLYIDRTGDLSLFGNSLRVIVTWNGASVAVPTARWKLVYYKQD